MKFSVFVCSCALLAILGFVEVTVTATPILAYNRLGNYYYYIATTPKQAYNAKPTEPPTRTPTSTTYPQPYQKHIVCVPRTFLFEECTLCFCTDVPNVGVCWDYHGEKCTRTQKLVEEQKNATNNDPNGIW